MTAPASIPTEQFISTLTALRDLEIEQSAARVALLEQAISEALRGEGPPQPPTTPQQQRDEIMRRYQLTAQKATSLKIRWFDIIVATLALPEWVWVKKLSDTSLRDAMTNGFEARAGLKNTGKLRVVTQAIEELINQKLDGAA